MRHLVERVPQWLRAVFFGAMIVGLGMSLPGCFWNRIHDDTEDILPVAAGFGKFVLRPILFMPAEARPTVASLRGQLEADGYRVSPNAELLVWPENPAAGWQVEMGATTVLTDVQGRFPLPAPGAGGTVGTLRHPTDTRYSVTFPMDKLTNTTGTDTVFVIPVPFKIDAMNPAASLHEGPPVLPPGFAPSFRTAAVPTKVTYGPRGSYPIPTTLICEDKNGPLSAVTTVHELVYLGSTCDSYVKAGACPNENFMSDIEYNALLALNAVTVTGWLDTLFGDKKLSPPITNPTSVLSCPDNHKGRVCQQVLIGDISVDIKGSVVLAGNSTTVQVRPGEVVPFVVHNNGNFGTSIVEKTRNEIGGVMTATGLKNTPAGGQNIEHWDTAGALVTYSPDRNANYNTHALAVPGQRDTYLFSTDGRTVEVTFVVVAAPPTASETTQVGVPVEITETFVVQSDPAGHAEFIAMPSQVNLTVTASGSSIFITGAAPFVPVAGTLSNGSFTCIGSGTVAGNPETGVSSTGTWNGSNLSGTYTMGTTGNLPQGLPIIYSIP